MLNKVIPVESIAGVLINHAHRITDETNENYVLRILRDFNKQAFIRAFSDYPELFTNSVWKLEKTMKALFLRRVSFWPRFHVTVAGDIDTAGMIDLIEIRVPMSEAMKHIQAATVNCMEACLAEVKRSNRHVGYFLNSLFM
jgi:DNA excision repair protein ERCC-4